MQGPSRHALLLHWHTGKNTVRLLRGHSDSGDTRCGAARVQSQRPPGACGCGDGRAPPFFPHRCRCRRRNPQRAAEAHWPQSSQTLPLLPKGPVRVGWMRLHACLA